MIGQTEVAPLLVGSLGSDLDALLSLVFTVLDSGTVLLTCARTCRVDLGFDSGFGISLRTYWA